MTHIDVCHALIEYIRDISTIFNSELYSKYTLE